MCCVVRRYYSISAARDGYLKCILCGPTDCVRTAWGYNIDNKKLLIVKWSCKVFSFRSGIGSPCSLAHIMYVLYVC